MDNASNEDCKIIGYFLEVTLTRKEGADVKWNNLDW